MKILLFGGTGQVGWELQRSLATLGKLVVLGRKNPTPLPADFSAPECLADIVRAVQPDLIVNAAAYTAVDKAEGEQELVRAINATAPGILAREAAASGAWLMHYSTDYVFNGMGSTPWVENSPTEPLNVYGWTKLEAEQLIRSSGCLHLIFRTSWVYAARGRNFVRTILRLARERDSLQVIDDQIGAPTGVELLADLTSHALRLAMQNPALAGTYHVAPAGETSWYGYARHIVEVARAAGNETRLTPDSIEPVPASAFPTVARRPANSRMNTEKLRSSFGVTLPTWENGVDRVLVEMA